MRHISISIGNQKLYVLEGERVISVYTISTALRGAGFEEGSYCTPTGRFVVQEKIGGGEPIGTIYQARKPIGLWQGEASDKDLVLTRILRLHGLDAENANTMARYIYIHGTNQEDTLGQAVSCGCIRMRNEEIVELFDAVTAGVLVQIGV